MEKSDESGQQLNYTEPASTRLSSQTYERFTQFTEQEDVGKSEGLRRLIRAGLDQKLGDDDGDDTTESLVNQLLNDPLIMVGIIFTGLALFGDTTQEFHILIGLTFAAGVLHTLSNR
jgi:hypothetical protein